MQSSLLPFQSYNFLVFLLVNQFQLRSYHKLYCFISLFMDQSINKYISELFSVMGFRLNIGKGLKYIYQQLNYLLRILLFKYKPSSGKSNFNQTLQIINLIVNSLAETHFGYANFYLNGVGRRLKKMNQNKILQSQLVKDLPTYQKNVQPILFKDFLPILQQKSSFINSSNLNDTIQDIVCGQIILQNPTCICCSQVFIKNTTMVNRNLSIPAIVSIGNMEQCNVANLERYFCGLSNAGGGALIIGGYQQNNEIYLKGIRFKNENEIWSLQKVIKQSMKKATPQFKGQIDRVIVQTNFAKPEKPHLEFMRFCYRILVIPAFPLRLTFIKSGKKQIYQLDSVGKPIICQYLYPLIHKGSRINVHRNNHTSIQHYVPSNKYSKFYLINSILSQNVFFSSSEQQMSSQDLKFKYKFTSLMVTSKKDDKRQIQYFEKYLKSLKCSFEIFRPFYHLYQEGIRSIWMISHTMGDQGLKNLLVKAELKKIISPSKITLMPVRKNLRINSQLCTKKHEQKIVALFESKYKGSMIKEVRIHQQKQFYIFRYNDYTESIYAYMLFQSCKLRPYFVQDGKN